MNIREFMDGGAATAIYPERGDIGGLIYVISGFAGEVGECFNVLKKCMRDDNWELTQEKKNRLISESGDSGWYISQILWEVDSHYPDMIKTSMELDNWTFNREIGEIGNKVHELRPPMTRLYDCSNRILQRLLAYEMLSENVTEEESIKFVTDILNDVFHSIYQISIIAIVLDTTFNEIMAANFDLLSKRKDANTLKGSGDGVEGRS